MILKELEKIEDVSKRLEFVQKNRAEIIRAKKSQIKWADPVAYLPTFVKETDTTKAEKQTEGIFKIVGNSVGFFDSHQDVSMKGSFTKTVNENGANVPILKNHNHSPDGIFARNMGVGIEEVEIKSLGYAKEGRTEVLTAKINPLYDEKMKMLYENKEIKQHSVGIRYVKIELAINDPSDNEGYANWQKYIDQVINREDVEQNKYFFAVTEQKLFEISAVLFGSNSYTPTLGEDKSSLEMEPPSTPELEPSEVVKSFINSLNLN